MSEKWVGLLGGIGGLCGAVAKIAFPIPGLAPALGAIGEIVGQLQQGRALLLPLPSGVRFINCVAYGVPSPGVTWSNVSTEPLDPFEVEERWITSGDNRTYLEYVNGDLIAG